MSKSKYYKHEASQSIKNEINQNTNTEIYLQQNNSVSKTKKTRKKIIKRIFMLALIVIFICIGASIFNRLLIRAVGATYMEVVLSERYNERFSYAGENDFDEYVFTCERFPDEEILLSVDTEDYNFWKHEKWYDNYLSVKYNKQAHEALCEVVEDVYGEDAKVDINAQRKDIIYSKYTVECDSFEYYMRNYLKYSYVKILVVCPQSAKEENLQSFISKLEKKDYFLNDFGLYYYDFKIRDYRNDVDSGQIYTEAIEREHITIDSNYKIINRIDY